MSKRKRKIDRPKWRVPREAKSSPAISDTKSIKMNSPHIKPTMKPSATKSGS
jgi:hypothetical protein